MAKKNNENEMQASPNFIQQGDVLLFRISENAIPTSAKQTDQKDGRVTVAYGEATGHSHFFDLGDISGWTPEKDKKGGGAATLLENDREVNLEVDGKQVASKMFVKLKEGMKLYHGKTKEQYLQPNTEAHKPIDVPAGAWMVRIVREVDPFTEAIRDVRD